MVGTSNELGNRPARDLSVRLGDIKPFVALGRTLNSRLWSTVRVAAANPDDRIDLADCYRLMRELLVAARDETFALSSRPLVGGSAEFVFASAAHSATVGEAARKIAQAYNILHGKEYNLVIQRGACLVYVMDDERFPYTQERDVYIHFSLECAMIFLHATLCELAGVDLTTSLKRVTTRRTRDGAAEGALAFWDVPLTYAAPVYSVTYDAEIAARPLKPTRSDTAPDLAVHNRILSLIEARRSDDTPKHDFADRVRRSIDDGAHDQEDVAATLGVSVATLRRRLAEHGDSFRSLLQARQNAEAKRRIVDGATVTAVAEDLGFSDMRAFTRAFKAWNGVSPSAYRAVVSETVP